MKDNLMTNLELNEVTANKAVTYIKTTGGTLADKIQIAIAGYAHHANDTSDWSNINKLVEALPFARGVKKGDVHKYINEVFTGIKIDKETKLYVRASKNKSVVIKLDILNAYTWDVRPDAAPASKELDVLEAINKIIKNSEKVDVLKNGQLIEALAYVVKANETAQAQAAE